MENIDRSKIGRIISRLGLCRCGTSTGINHLTKYIPTLKIIKVRKRTQNYETPGEIRAAMRIGPGHDLDTIILSHLVALKLLIVMQSL